MGCYGKQKHLPSDEAQRPPTMSAAQQAEEQSHSAPELLCAAVSGGEEHNSSNWQKAKGREGDQAPTWFPQDLALS